MAEPGHFHGNMLGYSIKCSGKTWVHIGKLALNMVLSASLHVLK